jgi:hypothetical protein
MMNPTINVGSPTSLYLAFSSVGALAACSGACLLFASRCSLCSWTAARCACPSQICVPSHFLGSQRIEYVSFTLLSSTSVLVLPASCTSCPRFRPRISQKSQYSCLQNRSHYAKNPRSEFVFVRLQGQTREAWNVTRGSARVQRQRRLARAAIRLARNACFACLSLEPYKQKLAVRVFGIVTTALQAAVSSVLHTRAWSSLPLYESFW